MLRAYGRDCLRPNQGTGPRLLAINSQTQPLPALAFPSSCSKPSTSADPPPAPLPPNTEP